MLRGDEVDGNHHSDVNDVPDEVDAGPDHDRGTKSLRPPPLRNANHVKNRENFGMTF